MNQNKKFDFKLFIKEHYKLIIPISLMVVLFVAFLIYYKVMISDQYHKDSKESVYQYFFNRKYEYQAIVSKNRKDVVVDFKPQDIKINLDSTPIYYQNKNEVILPKNMSVVMPTLNCAEYLSKGYSYITLSDGIYRLTTERYYNQLNHYFLYDGADLYFFIENVTLVVNHEEIHLSPFSYVIAKYGNDVSYYDKKSDTFKTITASDRNSLIKNEYYTIYIGRDTLDYQGMDVILTSDILQLNSIDQKD